jgi:hypothetical protein
MHCFVGCSVEEICSAIGLDITALFNDEDNVREFTPEKVTLSALSNRTGLSVPYLESLGLVKRGNTVLVPYYDKDKNHLYNKIRVQLSGRGKYRYERGAKSIPYGLWRLSDAHKIGGLVIVEGESDCWTLWKHDIPALGIPGASAWKCLDVESVKGIDKIYIIQEPGEAGQTFSLSMGEHLLDGNFTGQIRIIVMNQEMKDPNQMYLQYRTEFRKEFVRACKKSMIWSGESIEDQIVMLDTVTPGKVDFLWYPYIPRGILTILAGPGGLGKSTACYSIASTVTVGGVFPGDEFKTEEGRVLLFSEEDDISNVIRPKFDSNEADVSKVIVYDMERFDFMFSKSDYTRLELLIDRYEPKIVIFDPLVNFTGGKIDLNKSNEVRAMFRPLAAIARKKNIAIVIVAHTRKGGASNAAEAVSGSVDIVNASRSALVCYNDPESDNLGLITHAKHNYSKAGQTLKFEIKDDGSFLWAGYSRMGANELAQHSYDVKERKAVQAACEFLKRTLRLDAKEVPLVHKEAKALGIQVSHLRQAIFALGVRRRYDSGKWLYSQFIDFGVRDPEEQQLGEVVQFPEQQEEEFPF